MAAKAGGKGNILSADTLLMHTTLMEIFPLYNQYKSGERAPHIYKWIYALFFADI